jgi:hypothetical protein
MGFEALGPFIGLINFFRSIGERRDDRTRAALAALSKALTDTRFYLRDRSSGTEPSRARQDEIVRLWTAAAIELRGLDTNLAEICQYKADYWTDPGGWAREDVVEKCISIDGVFDRYRELLDVPGAAL